MTIRYKFLWVIVILLEITTYNMYSQKECFNWIFGRNCYITFNTPQNNPKNVVKSNIDTWEGCVSMSDNNGNLLFYSDGVTVLDKNHKVMQNGANLRGNFSSLQSGISFKVPSEIDKYYLFTIDAIESQRYGINYSIINMQMNNGLGAVEQKNVLVDGKCIEKIVAVPHKNKIDMWILSNRYEDNEYVAYLVNNKGVSKSPIISKGVEGGPHKHWSSSIKASIDGKMIVSSNLQERVIEIFDFNNDTGELILKNKIDYYGYNWAYDFEFSPNSKYLYVTTFYPCQVLQYDISLPTNEKIIQSSTTLDFNNTATFYFGSIQLAPDNKIYIAKDNSQYLSVINSPNDKGSQCLYD